MVALRAVYSPLVKLHTPPRGSGHAERPSRVDKALEVLRGLGVETVDPGALGIGFFSVVHDRGYLEELASESESALDSYFIDADTYLSPGSLAAMQALAGYGRFMVEAVSSGEGPLLAVSRPPGHHAGVAGPGLGAPSLAGSLVNLAAAVAAHLSRRGLKVLVIDFGLMHGNGTQEIVQALAESEVYMVDVHQDWRVTPPWTGEPGYTPDGRAVNVNLPEGAGDDIALAVIDSLRGVAEDLAPDAVVASVGFDAFEGDTPFTRLRLTEASYYELGSLLARLRAAVVMEEGFGPGLERGLKALAEAMLGRGGGYRASESGEEAWSSFEELNRDLVG